MARIIGECDGEMLQGGWLSPPRNSCVVAPDKTCPHHRDQFVEIEWLRNDRHNPQTAPQRDASSH
jgi:hypothetical protein